KAASAGNNPDPLATLWRGMAFCGHCGGRLHTAPTTFGTGRRYKCAGVSIDPETRKRTRCSGGSFGIGANVLDPAGSVDVVAWLTVPENGETLRADWQDEPRHGEHSIASRLQAADAQLATLRSKMTALAEAIGETTSRESRLVLQEKLDQYAELLRTETGKRE